MRSKSPELMKRIIEYIESYYLENYRSPSTGNIAENIGIAKSTVHKYLVDMDRQGMLTYSGWSITTEKTEKMKYQKSSAAILGSISCGVPNFAEENVEEYLSLPESLFGKGEFYILRANGLSMIDAGIDDGDLMVIRKQSVAENGEIVVALVEEEATLKRFYKDEKCEHIILHPENKSMEDIIVDNCIIQGVAVKVIKDLQ